MSALKSKNVLLGVTGGIAAYRSADLARRLRDQGADVRVVMTDGATQFITELTMQAVSGNPVRRELFDSDAEAGMGHIELARWADAIVVAPASANFLARLAHGLADDLLSTLCLAAEVPIAVAPAMNQAMWHSPLTQANVDALRKANYRILGPAEGVQACGETGMGRMLLPEELVQLVESELLHGPLSAINVLITAGATWEAIDPVRGITNRSSGKMGYAIADASLRAGARVTLISGPVTDGTGKVPAVHRFIKTESASDMLDAALANINGQHVFISVAAVADYRPERSKSQKIKKGQDALSIDLVKNPDILAAVKQAAPQTFAVGFAAETSNMAAEARRKLLAKGVELIAANDVSDGASAIGSDTNAIDLYDRSGMTRIGPASKQIIAERLVAEICERLDAENRVQNTR